MSMEGEYKLRKIILKWLFGVGMVDMDTYSELLNKYGLLPELGGTMEERIREALEFCVNNPDLDLKTFEQSKEYRVLNMEIPLSEHIGSSGFCPS